MAISTVRECERWLVRRGVPHLIADYDAREDIWTRSLPVLVVLYVATSYGVVPMLRWAAERSLALVESFGTVISRALPLLLVSITFLFFTSEVWQSVGLLHGPAYFMVLGLFFAIGSAFVL